MALSTEAANLVWQKAEAAQPDYKPSIKNILRALKAYLAQSKANPDLQFGSIISTSIDAAGGQVVADAACKLYAVVAKKAATATDVYLVIFDDATDDAGAGTDGRVVIPFLVSGEYGIWINPDGLAMGTGIVAKAYTDFDGTTDSTAADCPDGFAIFGKP